MSKHLCLDLRVWLKQLFSQGSVGPMLNTGFPSILTKAEGGSELGPHPKQSASPLSISHGSSPSASQRRTGLWSHASQYQILLACMNPMSSELDCFGLKVLLQNIRV